MEELLIGAHHSIAGGTPRAVELDFDRKNLETLRRLAADGPPAR